MDTTTQAQRNKDLVVAALREFAAGDHAVLRRVLREDFVEHNPANPSGRDAFADFVAASPIARATIRIERVVADEQYVVVHHLMHVSADDPGTFVVDIWRVEDGLIAEHWDVLQPVGGH